MNVDWVTIGIAIASALVTAVIHSASQVSAAQPATTPTPAPAPAPTAQSSPSSGRLFHGGLLNLIRGGSSASGSTSAGVPAIAPATASPSTNTVAPLATSHPVISSLLSILESEVNSTQGQQLLNQLSGALITLTGANGQQIAVQAGSQTTSSGGTTNAPAASSPVSVGS